MTTTERRIYVACLASYNNGTLYGRWIDAEQDVDAIRAEIAEMLRESKYPNVEVDCPHCDGIGHMMPDENCPECTGTGKVPSAEEWAVHDYEGFGGWKLDEHPDLEQVAAYAEAVSSFRDEDEAEAFAAWFDNLDASTDYTTADEMTDAFREAYRGSWVSLAEYVENFWGDCGDFDADKIAGANNWWHPARYVDWERMAHDLQISGDIWTHESGGSVHVFDNHA